MDLHHFQTERSRRSVHREKREPQLGPASRSSNTASKPTNAAGDGVGYPEPKTEEAAKGEVTEELSGSKSVARAEEDTRNWGGPEFSRRTNCEGQAGKPFQREEGMSEGAQGVGSDHSSPPQPKETKAEVGKGSDTITQSADETSTVRMTEERWYTFLRAIAEKAGKISPCLANWSGDLPRERCRS